MNARTNPTAMLLARAVGALAVACAPSLARAEAFRVEADGPALPGVAPVRATLLADVAEIRRGQPFRLGVLLTMGKGWHTYWQNPGDAGLATEITLGLPKGFVAGAMHWPVPVRFAQEGGLDGYGYGGEVLHWFVVRPPKQLASGGSVPLRADVSWLACRTECVPGEATLELTLPVAAGASTPARPSPSRKVFDTWQGRVPRRPAGKSNSPAIRVTPPASLEGAMARVELAVTWPTAAPPRVELFPGAADGLDVGRAQIRTRANVTLIAIPVQALVGQKPPGEFELLVVAVSAAGRRQGWVVSVVLPRPASSAPATARRSDNRPQTPSPDVHRDH